MLIHSGLNQARLDQAKFQRLMTRQRTSVSLTAFMLSSISASSSSWPFARIFWPPAIGAHLTLGVPVGLFVILGPRADRNLCPLGQHRP